MLAASFVLEVGVESAFQFRHRMIRRISPMIMRRLDVLSPLLLKGFHYRSSCAISSFRLMPSLVLAPDSMIFRFILQITHRRRRALVDHQDGEVARSRGARDAGSRPFQKLAQCLRARGAVASRRCKIRAPDVDFASFEMRAEGRARHDFYVRRRLCQASSMRSSTFHDDFDAL